MKYYKVICSDIMYQAILDLFVIDIGLLPGKMADSYCHIDQEVSYARGPTCQECSGLSGGSAGGAFFGEFFWDPNRFFKGKNPVEP